MTTGPPPKIIVPARKRLAKRLKAKVRLARVLRRTMRTMKKTGPVRMIL
jgi:hypothetical protein